MSIEETYAPTIHRISQAVRRRAIRPEEPVAPPAEILTRFSHPAKQLVEVSEAQLNKLIEVADVKKGRFPHVSHHVPRLTAYSASKG